MSLSPAAAGKHVGLTKQSVMKAIRSGRLSATRDAKGEWQIEPVELFRVWPAVNQDTGKVAPEVHAGNPPGGDDIVAILKAQLDDIRADRDHWREAAERQMAVADQERAERVALSERLLLTDQRPAPERVPETPAPTPTDIDPGEYVAEASRSLWSRLLGRS
jgi:hypothetical protein